MGIKFVSWFSKTIAIVTTVFIVAINPAFAESLPIRVSGVTFIMPINKPPSSNTDTFYVNEYGGICDQFAIDHSSDRCKYSIDVLANDTDLEGDALSLTAVSVASAGTIEISGDQAIYTPTVSFFSTGTDNFSYEVTDATGNKSQGHVSLIVNRAPIVKHDGFNVPVLSTGSPLCYETTVDPNDCRFLFDPVANDPVDLEGDAIAQIITSRNKFYGYNDILIYDPANGLDHVATDNKQIEFQVDSTCLYGGVPPEGCDYDKVGAADSAYRVVDSRGAISRIAFVNYAPNNHPPVAADDENIETLKNTHISINVLANDSDADANTFSLNGIVIQPRHGSTTIQGNQVVYTPHTGYVGKDQFDYEIKDSLGAKGAGTVYVLVIEPNTPPTAVNDSAQVNMNESVTIDVLSNDSDPENQTLSIVGVTTLPMNGTAAVVGNQITYTPDNGYSGTDEFIYQIQDSQLAVASANVSIQINAAPVVTPVTPIDTNSYLVTNLITATANATDSDGTIALVKFKLNTDANWQQVTSSPYSHSYGQLPKGNYNIQYQAVDNSGLNSTIKTVSFQVTDPVTVTASWSEDPVIVGQDIIFSWSSSEATGCTSPTLPFVNATSGAQSTKLWEIGTVSATVNCTNSVTGGTGSDSAATTVNKLPAPTNLQPQQQ